MSGKKGNPVPSAEMPDTPPGPSGLLKPGEPPARWNRGVLILLFVLLALFAMRQVGDPDVGFHLKAGDWFLSGHGWPGYDTFTYTLNDHPYVDTSWGYQVLLRLSHMAGGTPGMVVFHLMMLAGLFFLLYKTARLAPVDPATLVFLFGAGIVACELRYEIRPEILSYLFLAAILYLLYRRALGLKTALWLLPILLWLWANSHALFAMGWAAIACVAAGLWIRDRKPDEKLLLWGGVSLLTPLMNPYGFKGWVYPFILLTRFQTKNAFAQNISELASPFALRLSAGESFYAAWPIWTFRCLTVLAVAAFVLLLVRKKWWAAFIVLAFLPLSVRAIHNMPLLIITALPAMIWALPISDLRHLMDMPERRARMIRNGVLITTAVLAVVLGLRVMTGAYYISSRRPTRIGWDWNSSLLPVKAAEYVKRAGLQGPMLNHFNFGGYLMWTLPQRVFMDGRNEMAGEAFFNQCRAILSSPEALEEAARHYGFQWIILPYTAEPFAFSMISSDPHWRLACLDAPAAVVFVREGPGADRWVDRDSILRRPPPLAPLNTLPGLGGTPRRGPLMRWLSGLVARPAYPLEAKGRAVFHYFRGEYALAEAWYRAVLQEGGADYYEIYLNLGSSLAWQKKYDEAAACFHAVLREDPGNTIAFDNLAILERERSGRP